MISTIGFFNAGPFKGEHRIAIGPGAHAITARHDLDPKRSNAIGKSFLLEMVDYALTGRLRRERGFDADGWVTRGEREGRVHLGLEDGTWIERWKIRGQARQLRVTLPNRKEAAQDDAQAALFKHLKFDAEDFRHASYFEQREMARLVHADPGDRLRIVTGWLGLGKADEAEDVAGELAGEATREVDRLTARVAALRESQPVESTVDVDAIRIKAAEVRKAAEEAEGQARRARAAEDARHTIAKQEERVRFALDLAELKPADDALEIAAADNEEKVKVLTSARDEALRELRRREKVSLGMFDGRCPVADIACPAKDKINEDRGAAERAAEKATKAMSSVSAKLASAKELHAATAAAMGKQREHERDLANARAEVKKGAEPAKVARALLAAGVPDEHEEVLRQRAKDLHAEAWSLENGAQTYELQAKLHAENLQLIEKAEAELRAAAKVQARASAARKVIRTAQRRVGERALVRVEEDANAAIAEAGVPLTVRARWEREGKGAAKQCEECGAAFPTSVKVKQCARCGTPRGLQTTQRLDFVLSDSSGAYDDLAGIAWQLSAGAWLLGHRGSPWGTCMLDEPTGQLDQALRRGLVRYLSRVTAQGGAYRQLLVISHSSDTVDALPHRIEIACGADGARRIEVLS